MYRIWFRKDFGEKEGYEFLDVKSIRFIGGGRFVEYRADEEDITAMLNSDLIEMIDYFPDW